MHEEHDNEQTAARAAENESESKDSLRPFTQVLHDQRKGALHDEITKGLAEVVKASLATQKKGELTLKLKVAPGPDGVTINLFDDLTLKIPEHDKEAGLYFSDEHGSLGRRHPDQPQLPFTAVRGGQQMDPETGEVTT
jgi:hypothetical protein